MDTSIRDIVVMTIITSVGLTLSVVTALYCAHQLMGNVNHNNDKDDAE